MTPLWCFDFNENSEQQIDSIGFPFDTDVNTMFCNLLGIDEGIILIKNYKRHSAKEIYQRTIIEAIGKNPNLKIRFK
jgi:hypothetical protein